MDMARSLLEAKNLSNNYWAKAIVCVVYIINRCPRKGVKNIISKEAWSGRKCSFSHMRVVGCMAYAHVPNKLRNKLDNKR